MMGYHIRFNVKLNFIVGKKVTITKENGLYIMYLKKSRGETRDRKTRAVYLATVRILNVVLVWMRRGNIMQTII